MNRATNPPAPHVEEFRIYPEDAPAVNPGGWVCCCWPCWPFGCTTVLSTLRRIIRLRGIFRHPYARARLPGVFRRLCARKRVKPNLSDGVNRGLTALKIGKVVYKLCVNEKQISHLPVCKWLIFKWAQRGMIPRPSDYESAALTN